MTEASGWIPVSERLPDGDTVVLVHSPGASEPVWLGWYDDEREQWYFADAMQAEHVAHWMELPEAPAEVVKV